MEEKENEYYRLPLDKVFDKDLIDWIASISRNKKAEVVRHALRFYKSQLKEGETFIMPSSTVSKEEVVEEEETTETKGSGKKPSPALKHIKTVSD